MKGYRSLKVKVKWHNSVDRMRLRIHIPR